MCTIQKTSTTSKTNSTDTEYLSWIRFPLRVIISYIKWIKGFELFDTKILQNLYTSFKNENGKTILMQKYEVSSVHLNSGSYIITLNLLVW